MVDALKMSLVTALVLLGTGCSRKVLPPAPDASVSVAKDAAPSGPTLVQAAAKAQPYVAQCYASLEGLSFHHIKVYVVVDPRGEIKFAQLPREFGWGWVSACVERAVMTSHVAVDLAGPQTLEFDIGK